MAEVTKTYAELDEWIPTLEPGTYDLIVNCENVTADQFIGNEENLQDSMFSKKLNNAKENVFFNLKVNLPANILDIKYCFYNNMKIKTINILSNDTKEAQYLFCKCKNLVSAYPNLPNLKKASGMFNSCNNIQEINTSALINVNDTDGMFSECTNLENVNTKPFINTTDTRYMFKNCKKLSSKRIFSFPNLLRAEGMFYGCTSLSEVDISSFEKVTDITKIFENCNNLSQVDLGNINKNLTIISDAFNNVLSENKILKFVAVNQEIKDWIIASASIMKLDPSKLKFYRNVKYDCYRE